MSSPRDMLVQTRGLLIERAHACLRADHRVVAAWLGGSLGRGTGDAWSDVDLFVAVEDGAYDSFWSDRDRLFEQIGDVVFHQRPLPQNSTIPGGNFQLTVFSGPVEIDWTIGPVSQATRPGDSKLLFEHRPIPMKTHVNRQLDDEQVAERIEFFWAMAPIAVKYAAREGMLAAAGMISVLRQTLSEALPEIDHPVLSRLGREVALAEIARLCAVACPLDADQSPGHQVEVLLSIARASSAF